MWGLVFFVVAAAAPLTVMAGVAPLAISLGGIGAPGAYLYAGIVLLLFAVGFTAMSRYVQNAGAFYAYVARGLGKPAGVGASLVAVLSYNLIEIGLIGAFAYFASSTLAYLFGVQTPWILWAVGCIVVVWFLGHRRITLSAKVLGLALLAEVASLAIFAFRTLVSNDGLNPDSFAPELVFAPGAGAVFVLAFGAFVGFEATAIYAEESRDPMRTVPRATYVAVGFLALFYGFVVWMIVTAYGGGAVSRATDDPADMVFDAVALNNVDEANVMRLLIVTSAFAAVLAFHNASTRYLYALGREGILPRVLGRTSASTGAPHVAVGVQTGLALVVVAVFALLGADPYTQLLLWTNGPGILGVMALQALTSVAVIGFFRRDRHGHSPLVTLVAPALGALGLTVAVVLVVANFDLLTAAGPGINLALMLSLPVVFAVGIGLALRLRRVDPERYAKLTTFDLERG